MNNIKDETITGLIEKKEAWDIVLNAISDYSMATNKRAFPSYADGIKPVARRILFIMWQENITHFKKVSYVSGTTIRLHPHNDVSVADALVLLAQPFTINEPYILGQGNFGSEMGDPAAAGRYIECKLSPFAQEVMTNEIDKYSIDYVENYDNTSLEPVYLPTKLPLVLIQGSFGLGEAFVTSIMPHNITDVINCTIRYVKNHNITLKELVKGVYPDFPTGGIITNKSELEEFYSLEATEVEKQLKQKKRFNIKYRGKVELDEENYTILITELPYGVSSQAIKDRIIQEVKENNNPILSNIVNFGNRNVKNRIYHEIICKKNSNLQEIVNNLYEKTSLSTSSILSSIVSFDKTLRRLSFKDIIEEWYKVRLKTKRRKYNYEHSDLQNKIHILHGLKTIYDYKNEVVKLIMGCNDKNDAIDKLVKTYKLSFVQAKGICELQMHTLTRMSKEKLDFDINKNEKDIKDLEYKLYNIDLVIIAELEELNRKFGHPRRTTVINLDDKKKIEEKKELLLLNTIDTVYLIDRIGLNNTKTVQESIYSKKPVLGSYKITSGENIAIFTANNGLKQVKMGDFTPNLPLKMGTSISTLISIRENGENHIYTLNLNKGVNIVTKVDLNTIKSIPNVISAVNLRSKDDSLLFYNEKGEYILTKAENAQGTVNFNINENIFMICIDKSTTNLGITLYDKDNSSFLLLIPIDTLKITNKPTKLLSKLDNLTFYRAFPVESNKNRSILIGNDGICTIRENIVKNDLLPKKISVKAFNIFQG
jgi:DNA gyrase subunit A